MTREAMLAVWIALGSTGTAAIPAADATLVESGLPETVWYDAESATLRPVDVAPESDDSVNRKSRWLPRAAKVKSPTPATPSGTGILGSGFTVGNLLGWALIAAVVLAAGLLLGLLIRHADAGGGTLAVARPGRRSLIDPQMQAQIEQLPVELRRTGIHLRDEAERLMHAGQYDQAIILLFGHQLLLLDRAAWLQLSRGKTNRQYVREAAVANAAAGRILRHTAAAFERSYFGRYPITADEFAASWTANSELERTVPSPADVAA